MDKIFNEKVLIIGIICLLGILSCEKESDEEKQKGIDDTAVREYLDENSLNASKDPRGFYFEKLIENEDGQSVDEGKIVAVRYKISTLEGNLLEDLISEDSSVLLRQGTGNVFPIGFDYGIGLMKTHEKYKFYIPSYLAYFDYSNGSFFPAYCNFILEAIVDSVFSQTNRFEAEQDSIESDLISNQIAYEEFASGLYYSEVTLGTGDSPLDGNHVKIHFTRKTFKGEILLTTTDGDPITFIMGTGSAVEGLEDGLKQMREGGKAILYMPSKIGFGASLRILPSGLMQDLYDEEIIYTNVPPYEPLCYEVELLDVY